MDMERITLVILIVIGVYVFWRDRHGLQFDRMVKALNFMAFYDWYVRDSFVIKNNITQQWMMYCVLEYRAPARKRDRRDQDG